MTIEEYIDAVMRRVKNKAVRSSIRSELSGHIDDRIKYFTDSGFEQDIAEKKAIEHMGTPEKVGEQMNRLHNPWSALAVAIIMLFVAVIGNVLYFFNCHDFMIISTDPGEIVEWAMLCSFFTFSAGTVCYIISLKYRFSALSIIYGVFGIIQALSSLFIYLPVGYSIIGFFTDFPALFINPENPDFLFFSGATGASFGLSDWSTIIDNYDVMCAVDSIGTGLITAFTMLFFLSPVINGIMALLSGIRMHNEEEFENRKKHYIRFAKILFAITVMCAFTMTCEVAANEIKIDKINNHQADTRVSCSYSAKAEFDRLTVPMTTDEVYKLAHEITDDEYLIADIEYGVFTVYENEHFAVTLSDMDSDGEFETKRIYSFFFSDITEEYCDKIEKSMTSQEVIDYVGMVNISNYSCDGNTEFIEITVNDDKYLNKINNIYYHFSFENGKMTDIIKESYQDNIINTFFN